MTPKNKSLKYLVGSSIRKKRMQKKLTQHDLAILINVDRQYVWKIEQGKVNLTLDYLENILFKLDCCPNEFIKD